MLGIILCLLWDCARWSVYVICVRIERRCGRPGLERVLGRARSEESELSSNEVSPEAESLLDKIVQSSFRVAGIRTIIHKTSFAARTCRLRGRSRRTRHSQVDVKVSLRLNSSHCHACGPSRGECDKLCCGNIESKTFCLCCATLCGARCLC